MGTSASTLVGTCIWQSKHIQLLILSHARLDHSIETCNQCVRINRSLLCNTKSQLFTDEEEQAEDAASRWREGVLEDGGASSSFASAFNLASSSRQSSAPSVATGRKRWSPAASQVRCIDNFVVKPRHQVQILVFYTQLP